jgi:hypothetical protein
MPKQKELGVAGDRARGQAGPRQLDHRSHEEVGGLLVGGHAQHEVAGELELARVGHPRDHDRQPRRPAGTGTHGAGGAEDRAGDRSGMGILSRSDYDQWGDHCRFVEWPRPPDSAFPAWLGSASCGATSGSSVET